MKAFVEVQSKPVSKKRGKAISLKRGLGSGTKTKLKTPGMCVVFLLCQENSKLYIFNQLDSVFYLLCYSPQYTVIQPQNL